MKPKVLWIVISTMMISLGCLFSSRAIPESPRVEPITDQTPLPPMIIEVTPTRSVFAAEEANAGTHQYWMSPNAIGCEASGETGFAQFRDKEHQFSADFSTVAYGGRTYPRVGEHRYQSINQENKPLVLEYSEHGFILYVYEPGKDPNVDDWCLTFSFMLSE